MDDVKREQLIRQAIAAAKESGWRLEQGGYFTSDEEGELCGCALGALAWAGGCRLGGSLLATELVTSTLCVGTAWIAAFAAGFDGEVFEHGWDDESAYNMGARVAADHGLVGTSEVF